MHALRGTVGSLLTYRSRCRSIVSRMSRSGNGVGSASVPQRKVIDSGMLQSPLLHRYLSASASNYAVLPDFVSIEAYKIGSIDRILERWEVISQFPKQVIVLKGTSKICGLRGRPSGLQRRLIDDKQTAGFGEFCTGLKLARAGDVRYGRALMRLGAAAKGEID